MEEELKDIEELEITKEDLEKLSLEELADIKVGLEELAMQCEEILEDNE